MADELQFTPNRGICVTGFTTRPLWRFSGLLHFQVTVVLGGLMSVWDT